MAEDVFALTPILLAMGIGVSPYRVMLPQFKKLLAKGNGELALLYSARNETELLFR